MHNVAQFKLSSGDEIICEVMEYPADDNNEYIIRNAMCLSIYFDNDFGARYTLRPWMTYVDGPSDIICVSVNHVVSSAYPNEDFVREYVESIHDMKVLRKKREQYHKMMQEEDEKRLNASLKRVMQELGMNDSILDSDEEYTNVIPFPTNDDTIH